jgi:hypothetical protein
MGAMSRHRSVYAGKSVSEIALDRYRDGFLPHKHRFITPAMSGIADSPFFPVNEEMKRSEQR